MTPKIPLDAIDQISATLAAALIVRASGEPTMSAADAARLFAAIRGELMATQSVWSQDAHTGREPARGWMK